MIRVSLIGSSHYSHCFIARYCNTVLDFEILIYLPRGCFSISRKSIEMAYPSSWNVFLLQTLWYRRSHCHCFCSPRSNGIPFLPRSQCNQQNIHGGSRGNCSSRRPNHVG